jgi:2'-5' RNA ligase
METRYSVAVCPPKEIVDQVRAMKDELFAKIGWYNSRSSDAHVTFNVFTADDPEVSRVIKFLSNFCENFPASKISFTGTGSYPGGAFYLTPDQKSNDYLMNLMKHFYSRFPKEINDARSDEPHMSIGRQLKDGRLEIAEKLWADRDIHIGFLCDRLSLRRFDPAARQYSVVAEFLFGQSHAPND